MGVGAGANWPQIPRSHPQYKQRIEEHYQNFWKNKLKRRLVQSHEAEKKKSISHLKAHKSIMIEHSFMEIVSGQTFNEEGILLRTEFPSQYTAIVTSNTADIEVISELQLRKRMNFQP